MKPLLFCILFCFSFVAVSIAKNGDTIRVIPHNKTFVTTDPSKGTSSFFAWAKFPGKEVKYRKAILFITFQCPDSLHCGEWDYVDNIVIRKTGGTKGTDQKTEISRLISPYGWRFGNEWKFTWHTDITDFSLLLHDSVEVEFRHSGYENNKDRGWLVTLDFMLIEGTPVYQPVALDTLWNGNITYGDSLRPFEKIVTPRKFNVPAGAEIARLRILQTGHGMDEKENCAEFCSKYRDIIFDGQAGNRRLLWKECGDNPLYPQAGTWLFDRANWCPGAVVIPDAYDFETPAGTEHSLGIVMQPYVYSGKAMPVYALASSLIFYKKPLAKNDVSVEEIIAPSLSDEYKRFNPVCAKPVILIKNNASRPLNKVQINWGIKGTKAFEYLWQGNIEPGATARVVLPGWEVENSGRFRVEASKPNGKPDEYPEDNAMESDFVMPPVYDSVMVMNFMPNHDSTHVTYQLRNYYGQVLYAAERVLLWANSLYTDTFRLTPGCYLLEVVDTAGDGLDFWFNQEGGYGYARLTTPDGKLVKNFNPDFGNSILHYFMVDENLKSQYEPETPIQIFTVFPAKNTGKFSLDVFLNRKQDLVVSVVNSEGNKVWENIYSACQNGIIEVSVDLPDGIYSVVATAGNQVQKQRIKVEKKLE